MFLHLYNKIFQNYLGLHYFIKIITKSRCLAFFLYFVSNFYFFWNSTTNFSYYYYWDYSKNVAVNLFLLLFKKYLKKKLKVTGVIRLMHYKSLNLNSIRNIFNIFWKISSRSMKDLIESFFPKWPNSYYLQNRLKNDLRMLGSFRHGTFYHVLRFNSNK